MSLMLGSGRPSGQQSRMNLSTVGASTVDLGCFSRSASHCPPLDVAWRAPRAVSVSFFIRHS